MPTPILTNTQILSDYGGVLIVAATGISGSDQTVYDGLGNSTALVISTASVKSIGALGFITPYNSGAVGVPGGYRCYKSDLVTAVTVISITGNNSVTVDVSSVSTYINMGPPATRTGGPAVLGKSAAGFWSESNDFSQDLPLIQTDGSNNLRVGNNGTVGGTTQSADTYLDMLTGKTGHFTVNNTDVFTWTATNFATVAGTWVTDTSGAKALAANFTDNTGTLTNTNLSWTAIAGDSYEVDGLLIVSNSTPADGFKCDFNGGGATATTFNAAATVVGSAVAGTVVTSSLSGALNWTTITGTDYIYIRGYFRCNAAGTLIFRAATNTAVSGTMTLAAGSWISLRRTGRV
jgi:hypothetical protein